MRFLELFFFPTIIGIIGGFSAIFIRKIIDFAYINVGFLENHSNFYYLFFIPLVFVISSFLINKLIKDPTNPTIDSVARAITLNKGKLNYKKGILGILLTSINIGIGTPVGREGPIAKFGGVLSYLLTFIFKSKGNLIPLYVTCGVTSALAATFNAPMAAIIFGIEIILGKINLRTITPLAISAIIATFISRHYLGDYPTFYIHHLSFSEKLIYLSPLFALIFALIILGFEYLHLAIKNFYEKYKFNFFKKALFGGVIVGIILTFIPNAASLGYDKVSNLFSGSYSLYYVFLLGIAKFLAVTFTLASGIYGGVFAPFIFIGAFLGDFLGNIIFHNHLALSVALIGTAALTAGITNAPLRSSFIIIEMTKNYQLSIAILLTSLITVYLVNLFGKKIIFYRSIMQKGFDITDESIKEKLKSLRLSVFIKKDIYELNPESKITDVLKEMIYSHSNYFPVIEENRLIGIVSFRDIRNAKSIKNLKVKDIMTPNPNFLTIKDDAFRVLEVTSHLNADYIPVVETKKNRIYVGMFDVTHFKKIVSLFYIKDYD